MEKTPGLSARGRRLPSWAIPAGLLAYAFGALFFCSFFSPLYVLQDWVDPHAYFTVGKGLMQGLVPYRDLFDHKGPLLYLLYGLGWLVQPDGLLGPFLLQGICLGLTLVAAYHTVLHLTGRRFPSGMLALMLPLFTLARGLDSGGGSSEEIFLPMMACSLLFVVQGPGTARQTRRRVLLCGVFCGCALMMKFTQAAFFVGLGLPLALGLVAQGRWRALLTRLGLFGVGILLVVAPYLVYAALTQSLPHFVEAYLKLNLTYAGVERTGGLLSLGLGGMVTTLQSLLENPLFAVVSAGGLGYLLFGPEGWSVPRRMGLVLGYLCLAVATNASYHYPYYTIPLSYLCLFGYLAAYRAATPGGRALPRPSLALVGVQAAVLLALTVAASGRVTADVNRLYQKEVPRPVQLTFGDILKREPPQERSLLSVASLDMGFYTYGDVLPGSRFFFMPNVSYNQFPDILNGQLQDVRQGLNTYVTLWWKPTPDSEADSQPTTAETISQQLAHGVASGYTLVGEGQGNGFYEGKPIYLWKRNDRWMAQPGDSFVFTPGNLLLAAGGNARRQGDTLLAQGEGLAVTGPHVPLGAGSYEATFAFSQVEALDFGSIYVDVTDYGMPLSEEVVEEAGEVTVSFELYEDTQDVELRVYLADDSRLRLDSITLRLVET